MDIFEAGIPQNNLSTELLTLVGVKNSEVVADKRVFITSYRDTVVERKKP